MSSDPITAAPITAAVRGLGSRGLGIEGIRVDVVDGPSLEQHWVADIRRDVFSASKTVTALAIGIAAAEGRLAIEDPIVSYLNPPAAADGVEAITIRQLLTMCSGITYRWDDPDADHPDDPARDILHTPLGSAPGSTFAYRGANTYLLSRIVHACTGMDLRDYLLPRLFTPLGIGNPQWLRCPLGFSLGAVGLQLRTGELARITRLLRDGGRWDGQDLIAREYIESLHADPIPTNDHVASGATEPHPDNARYGRHVWLCARDEAWRMDGIYGQFGIVLPQHRAAITITAHYRGPTTDILDAVWTDVVPALN